MSLIKQPGSNSDLDSWLAVTDGLFEFIWYGPRKILSTMNQEVTESKLAMDSVRRYEMKAEIDTLHEINLKRSRNQELCNL